MHVSEIDKDNVVSNEYNIEDKEPQAMMMKEKLAAMNLNG
jgi:hypothetical protein